MKESTMSPKSFAFRVGWFILGVLSLVLAAMLWFVGIFSGGLEVDETCNLLHGQTYDRQYRQAHPEHAGRSLFPLSDKCNDGFDMVPVWMNPAIAGLVLFGAGTTVALPIRDVTRYVQRRRQTSSAS